MLVVFASEPGIQVQTAVLGSFKTLSGVCFAYAT